MPIITKTKIKFNFIFKFDLNTLKLTCSVKNICGERYKVFFKNTSDSINIFNWTHQFEYNQIKFYFCLMEI